MGSVVQLRPDAVAAAHAEWVRIICDLADAPDRAKGYIDCGTPRRRIIAELRCLFFGHRSRDGADRYIASLMGPHRPGRRHVYPSADGHNRRPLGSKP